MPSDTQQATLLTVDEAAAYLGIGRNLFFKLRREGWIKQANFNPLSLKQYNPLFSRADLDSARADIIANRKEFLKAARKAS